jgi:hypothetical protein
MNDFVFENEAGNPLGLGLYSGARLAADSQEVWVKLLEGIPQRTRI